MNNTNAKLKLTIRLDESREKATNEDSNANRCCCCSHTLSCRRWAINIDSGAGRAFGWYMVVDIYSKSHKVLRRVWGDWTNTLIQGIFRYFHKYSFLLMFVAWTQDDYSNPNNERCDSIIRDHEFRVCLLAPLQWSHSNNEMYTIKLT